MYYLSKIVWFVIEPSNALSLLALIGLLLAGRGGQLGRIARRVGLVAAAGLLVAGLSPLGSLMLRPLEQRFPAFVDDGRGITGAVVLGGAIDPEVSLARGQLAMNESSERIFALPELHLRYPAARLVFTGGSGDLAGITAEADALAKVIGRYAADLPMTYERASRNTVENAEFTRAIVQPKPGERWLLVTSAWHMPRSIGIFRRAGWEVTAYPVDFRTSATGEDFRPFTSVSNGLRRTDLALKEWVGMIFAYISGKSSALFPAP